MHTSSPLKSLHSLTVNDALHQMQCLGLVHLSPSGCTEGCSPTPGPLFRNAHIKAPTAPHLLLLPCIKILQGAEEASPR